MACVLESLRKSTPHMNKIAISVSIHWSNYHQTLEMVHHESMPWGTTTPPLVYSEVQSDYNNNNTNKKVRLSKTSFSLAGTPVRTHRHLQLAAQWLIDLVHTHTLTLNLEWWETQLILHIALQIHQFYDTNPKSKVSMIPLPLILNYE
jgi:hypothetical protein